MAIPAGFDPKQAHVVAQWPAGRPMVCCRFEPRGRFVFCGLEARTIQRFNLADGKKVAFRRRARFVGLLAGVLARRRDDSTAAAATAALSVWETEAAAPEADPDDRSPSRVDPAHGCQPRRQAHRHAAATTGPSGSGRRQPAELVRELNGHLNHVYSLEFHPDGKTLAER